MELGKNIYELRRERGVTQEELAAELGVTAAAVSKWEKGNTLPDVLMVCALAAIGLNTSFSSMKKAGIRPMIHGFIISALVVIGALLVEMAMGIV